MQDRINVTKSLRRFCFSSLLREGNQSHQSIIILEKKKKKRSALLWARWIFERQSWIQSDKWLTKIWQIKKKAVKKTLQDDTSGFVRFIYQWHILLSVNWCRWHSSTNTLHFCPALMLWRRKPSFFQLKTSWFWRKK